MLPSGPVSGKRKLVCQIPVVPICLITHQHASQLPEGKKSLTNPFLHSPPTAGLNTHPSPVPAHADHVHQHLASLCHGSPILATR